MEEQNYNSSPSCDSDGLMKDECSRVTDSHRNSCRHWHYHSDQGNVRSKLHNDQEQARKRQRIKLIAAILLRSGLMEVALEIGKLTRESRQLQREIDAMLQDISRCESNKMKRRRAIRNFGSTI